MGESNHVVSAEFHDFDAFVEAVENAEFEMTISSLDCTLWTVDNVSLPDGIHVQNVFEGAGTHVIGATPDTGGILWMHGNGLVLASGEEMLPGSAFIMPAGAEFVLCNNNSARWLNIFLPEPLMHDLGLNEDATGMECRRPYVVRPERHGSDLLWRQINAFLFAAAAGPEIPGSAEALASFQEELVHTIRGCYGRKFESPKPRRGRPIVTDRLMVARAIDAIEGSGDCELSINDLVAVTGVSERSLRAGFHRYFGVSPKCFMQLHTLNRARKRLLRARTEDTTVTRVAADLGQWDVGSIARSAPCSPMAS